MPLVPIGFHLFTLFTISLIVWISTPIAVHLSSCIIMVQYYLLVNVMMTVTRGYDSVGCLAVAVAFSEAVSHSVTESQVDQFGFYCYNQLIF